MELTGTAVTVFYDVMFGISLVLLFVYLAMWHRHFDVHLTLLFVLLPVTNFAYPMMQRCTELGGALIAKKITYVGGCYFMLLLLLLVFSLCKIRVKRWMRLALVGLTTAVFLSSMTIGLTTFFYKNVRFSDENGIIRVTGDYGVLHTVFYAMVISYFVLMQAALLYSYFKKTETSRKTIRLLVWPITACIIIFFLERPLFPQVELIPLGYNFATFMTLFIAHRLCMYEVTDTAVDSLIENGTAGIASFDWKLRYLGSNETAKKYLPSFDGAQVDGPIQKNEKLKKDVAPWLNAFRIDEKQNSFQYARGGRIYKVDVGYLYDHSRKRGYQISINDDTENVAYIELLENYKRDLEADVAEKTEHIVTMNNQFVLAMATMVESRDNSTGGHIRRTSEGVNILLRELRAADPDKYPEKFCRDLAKAAPMHDLGKIAVDDVILRKPGRFTPEEFEQMKVHAPEGAKIVRNVLKGMDDADFKRIAENVAHYHHERWDGSGYPDGKKGTEIPLEARVMAVADVYDALVSKRVYKDRMSFSQAEEIILEGMGKHFDPSLEEAFRKAIPKLREYYTRMEEQEQKAQGAGLPAKEAVTAC